MTQPTRPQDQLRATMGSFVTGVTILCSGRPDTHGMTLNALTSVSLDPPQVVVCIDQASRMRSTIEIDGTFSLSVLGAEAEDAAQYFASKNRPYGRSGFRGFDTAPGPTLGHPIFDTSVAWLECEVEDAHVSGDHTMFVGTMLACGPGSSTVPLLFSNGRLCSGASLTALPAARVVA